MANKKFLNPINLVNLASDPTTASEGDVYYNTTDDAVKVYAKGIWVPVGNSSTNIHASAKLATTANITGTYTPGTIDQNSGYGIGATLTATATGRGTIDGVLITTGDRILVKNQATSTHNGVYVVTTQGSAGVSFVLTRATDFNNSIADQVTTGDFLYVTNGTVNATTNWILNSTGTGGVIVIGTDEITFAQVGGVGPQGPTGATGAGGVISNYGSFYSTVDQSATTGGEAVKFDATNVKNGVTLVTNGTSLTRITVPVTGTYMIDFAGQVASTGGTVHQANFWLVKNGTTAVSTAFDTVVRDVTPALTNWVWQVDATANDYYEVFWNSTSTNVFLNAVTASSPVPAAAGAFVRVTQVTYQGLSGVVNVTSPITNSGTTTEAQLGFDDSTFQKKVTGVSDTEIGYLDGVTSALQTQINGKSSTSHNHTLNSLSNVVVTSPTAGQSLVWDATTSKWINETVSGGGGSSTLDGITDVTITGTPADNNLLAYDTETSQWINQTSAEAGLLNTSATSQTKAGDLTITGNLTVNGTTTTINSTAVNVNNQVIFEGSIPDSFETTLTTINPTTDRTINLPDASGTLALTASPTFTGSVTVGTDIGSTGSSLQITNDVQTSIRSLTNSVVVVQSTGISLNSGGSGPVKTWIFKNNGDLTFPDASNQSTAFLGISAYDTDDISEGTTNKYFTDARAVSALSSTLSNYLTTSSASSTYLTQSSASSTYQPKDQDLTDIAALTGNGIIRKTSGTWGMDNNTYLTSGDVSGTYATISSLSSYLTTATAATTYQPIGDYLTSETDPVFVAHAAYGITSTKITDWDTAYGWGNHSLVGYLTSSSLSGYATETYVSTGYQTKDQDLTDISALTGDGLLRRQSSVWEMDTTDYATTSDLSNTVADYILLTEKGSSLGVAELDVDSLIITSQIPDLSATYSTTSHNHTLDSLSNVVITGTPTDGQAIVWDTTTSKWVNETVSGGASYPTQSGNNGKFLQTNGSIVSWQSVDLSSYLTTITASTTYQPLDADLTAIAALFGNGILKKTSGTWGMDTSSYLTSYTETSNLEDVTDRGATSSNAITISNTTESTTPTSGALIVSGGVGIAKDLWIDGDLHVNGTTTTLHTHTIATSDNLIYLNAAHDSTITNAVGDGTYVTYTADNDYTPGMDIRVTGMTPSGYNISNGDELTVYSATSTQFVVAKNTTGLFMSGGTAHAKYESNADLGFAGGYYNAGYAHAGLFRDASDGIFKFFDGYTPEPDEAVNIDTGHGSFSFATIAAKSISSSYTGNFGIGYETFIDATPDNQNFSIGTQSSYLNTGSSNYVFGFNAGYTNTGSDNYGIGNSVLAFNNGSSNYAIGINAGSNNIGNNNYGIGNSVLAFNNGSSNYAIGTNAGSNNTGNNNYGFGDTVLQFNSGSYNYAIGANAGSNNTGNNNLFIGSNSGYANTGNYNIYIGPGVGLSTDNNIVIYDVQGNLAAKYNSTDYKWQLGGFSILFNDATLKSTVSGVSTISGYPDFSLTIAEFPINDSGYNTLDNASAAECFIVLSSNVDGSYYSSKVLVFGDNVTEYAIINSGTWDVTLVATPELTKTVLSATVTNPDMIAQQVYVKVVSTSFSIPNRDS